MNISLFEGVLLANFLKFIGVIMVGLFIGVIASVIRNLYISIIAAIVVTFENFFFSALFDKPYLMPFRLLMPYQAINTNNVFRVLIVAFIIIGVLFTACIFVNNERSQRRLV